jgi:hypothetical protein
MAIAVLAFGITYFTGNVLFASSIIYDNTDAPTGMSMFGGSVEYGDEITLGGFDRTITDFEFNYSQFNDAYKPTARIRFYKNDDEGRTPGTQLYDSGNFAIPQGVGDFTYSLRKLSVTVPDTFTWTVAWGETPHSCCGEGWESGMGTCWCLQEPHLVSLSTYNPPAIGLSDSDYWSLDYYTSSWIKEKGDDMDPYNFGAKVTATTVPEPSSLLLVGAGIIGLFFGRERSFEKNKRV